ncbi:SpoIID/LytB domain-containing protein [Luteimonas sp. RD2P54]|uniref:SpoIID/LytB domain-containing protein n=1 Tax=Luteimonas endophytica TaxID=3042023 RepID=A0ABT6JDZ7_9GAMM|nr:SpoIID/LytB domain-containing protein [Luteimonas endophytica]MDH5824842.1 SpoIID/LytB domain-containing protein [Luteimonas endophytica]
MPIASDRGHHRRGASAPRAVVLLACAALLVLAAAYAQRASRGAAVETMVGESAQGAQAGASAPRRPARVGAPGLAAGKVAPRIRVRDSASGRALAARLVLEHAAGAAPPLDAHIPRSGARLPDTAPGEYLVTAAAPGQAPLAARIVFDTAPLPITLWLPPAATSTALHRQALAALDCGHCSLIGGHVYDRDSGVAVPGAVVAADGGQRAVTDAEGAFELLLRLPPAPDGAETPPASATLTISAGGYRRQQLERVALSPDAAHHIIDLERGSGVDRQDHGHVLANTRSGAGVEPGTGADVRAPHEPPGADRGKAHDPAGPDHAQRAARLARAAAVPVPASIRVGTGCSGRSCTGVSVYEFEDYVGRGLDDEWIASWDPDSLAAGAVAYRSYAAWYVANPVGAAYDICSSTSCQAFGSAAWSATVAAAAATRGVLLTRDGSSAAFAEYSAENNAWDDPSDGRSCSNPDLSCGNGRNGSPANGWPCLADEVGRGRGCFGHGRGMSQWGTQRWAADHGRGWRWIADHYYNGNGRPGGMRNAFLANLDPIAAEILEDFEAGAGRFDRQPTESGSTVGVSGASRAQRDCGVRRDGDCSLRVLLRDDPAVTADWSVRLLSGGGSPAANRPLPGDAGIGLWVYSGGTGMRIGIGIDDADGTERSTSRAIASNQWTWLEWNLADPAQWNAWVGGSDGAIDGARVTLDAIWLYRAQTAYDVNVYLDDVQIREGPRPPFAGGTLPPAFTTPADALRVRTAR